MPLFPILKNCNKKSDIRAKGLSDAYKKHRTFCPAHYSSLL